MTALRHLAHRRGTQLANRHRLLEWLTEPQSGQCTLVSARTSERKARLQRDPAAPLGACSLALHTGRSQLQTSSDDGPTCAPGAGCGQRPRPSAALSSVRAPHCAGENTSQGYCRVMRGQAGAAHSEG